MCKFCKKELPGNELLTVECMEAMDEQVLQGAGNEEEQEQALIDAIARQTDITDGESGTSP